MARIAAVILALAACGGGNQMTTKKDAAPADGDARDADAAVPAHLVAYVAGYGPNIAWLDLDLATGALSPSGTVAAAQAQPSFLALTATHAYAVSESGNRIAAYAIDPQSGALAFINDVSSGGTGPAHVSVDAAGKIVLVANYGSGAIETVPVRGDGGLGAPNAPLNAGTNAHEIVTAPGNHFAIVPCKGADYLAQYTFDPATGALAANAVPHVAVTGGPRHIAFAPDGAHAYVITETASTLVALAYDAATGHLTVKQTVSTRAAGATGTNTGAEVAVHPNGKWVYVSNRGDNTIGQFAIAGDTVTLVGHTPSGGATPRAFAIDPTGAWLFAANQGGNSVVAFAIDPVTGALSQTGSPLTATQPSYVGFVALRTSP